MLIGECYHKCMITCERCGKKLTGKQTRWCSKYCSDLGLKSLWRKRNIELVVMFLERILKQNREYRKAKNGGMTPPSSRVAKQLRGNECYQCGSGDDLQLAHVKPLWAGGTHDHTITLCRKHHYQFDNLLRDFWHKKA